MINTKKYIKNNSKLLLKEALDSGWITPYFQPLICARTGECCGAEVLARIQHPQAGIISPEFFLSSMTRPEELTQLTCTLIKLTHEWLTNNPMPPAFMLAFNIIPDTVFQPWLLPSSLALLVVHDCVPVLELTEQRPLDGDRHAFKHAIAALRQAGIRMALDDFGTGHSGLSLLQQAGGDFIKIPRQFVSSYKQETFNDLIIDNIIHLADSMGMQVIAEGVDNLSCVKELSARGVFMMQGEYFSMPLNAEDFMTFLASQKNSKEQSFDNQNKQFIDQMMSSALLRRCAELHHLSQREAQAVESVARCISVTGMSKKTGRSTKTCSAQKHSAFKKIGVRTDVEFIHYLYQLHSITEGTL